MDAAEYLKRQGWRGEGHALSHTGNGIKKPLLVSKKVDVLGVGLNKHAAVSDQWWMRAFDQGLKDLGTGKKTVLSTVREQGVSLGGLYGRFVRGEAIAGTFSENESSSDASAPVLGQKRKRTDDISDVKKQRKLDKAMRGETTKKRKRDAESGGDEVKAATKATTATEKEAKREAKRLKKEEKLEKKAMKSKKERKSEAKEASQPGVEELGFVVDTKGDAALDNTNSAQQPIVVLDNDGNVRRTFRPDEAIPLDKAIWDGITTKLLPRPVRKARREYMAQKREARKIREGEKSGNSEAKQSKGARKISARETLVTQILVKSRQATKKEGATDKTVTIENMGTVPMVKMETKDGPFSKAEMASARTAARRLLKAEKKQKKAERPKKKKVKAPE